MSIQINKLKCVGCGKCVEACSWQPYQERY
ncbi:MAG: 4Fe-4S binding protein [Lachnospira eligens]